MENLEQMLLSQKVRSVVAHRKLDNYGTCSRR